MPVKNLRNILIFRIGSIGDTVISVPCFHLIRRCFPKANISVLTNVPNSKQSPLIEVLGKRSGFVDNVISYPSRLSNPLEAIKLIIKLRKCKVETMIYLMPTRTYIQITRDKIFFKLAGIKNMLCVPSNKDQRNTRVNPQTRLVEPEIERLIRCTKELGEININDINQWNIKLSATEKEIGKKLTKKIPFPFLAIHTGGIHMDGKNKKDWGYDKWAELIKLFKDKSNARGLMIVGSSDDIDRANALLKIWGQGGAHICGITSPRETTAVLSHAKLFCGHDSGPMHLAQSVGVTTLGIFGDYNKPYEWHPIGTHVTVIHELKGINQITVSRVLQAMLKKWHNS
jgi:ADP-heptose:LPS heptosyltransferase